MKHCSTTTFSHITLQEKTISYKTIYSSRAKYLRLQINSNNELEVILPIRYRHEKAEDFILQKKKWILKHLKEKVINKFYFLGKEISVSLSYDLFLRKPFISFSNNKLKVNIPSDYKSIFEEDFYNFWLKHQAKLYIPNRVELLADKTGFYFNKITVRSQKTRWGSCTSAGSLSFNYRLMKFRKEVIDYVIIHELCHLKEMNHSKKFWKLVERFCPDYMGLRKELKRM